MHAHEPARPVHALILALFTVFSAVPARANKSVFWNPPNAFDRQWTRSEWWNLDPLCNQYPDRGMVECCNCGPEFNWFVTLGSPHGVTMDVDVTLAGLDHVEGQVNMAGHAIIVDGFTTLGDGNAATGVPNYSNTSQGATSLSLLGGADFLDDHMWFQLDDLITGGPTRIAAGITVSFKQGSTLLNHPGGVWTLEDGTVLQGTGGSPNFLNQGMIQKVGSGTANLLVELDQPGSLIVTAGEVGLDRSVRGAGLLRVEAGALLSMASGGFLTDWDGVVVGDGDVRLGNQRTAIFDGPYDIEGWTTVESNAVVDFAQPAETARLLFKDSSGATGIHGTLLVEDELSWEGGELFGRMDVLGTARIGHGTGVAVVEDGTLVFASGAQVVIEGAGLRGRNVSLVENHGRVVQESGTLDGSVTSDFRNHGRFKKLAGSLPTNVGMNFYNDGGHVIVEASTLRILRDQLQTSGRTLLLDGRIEMQGGAPFELQGGKLAGYGVINGSVHVASGGRLAPGWQDSSGQHAGEIALQLGDLVQDPGSSAHFHLAGHNRGIDYDAVTGATNRDITVAGALVVHLVGGFPAQIQPTDTFVLYDSGAKPIQGSFDNVPSGSRIWASQGGGSFAVHYGPGSPFPESQVVLTRFRPRSVVAR